MKIASLDLHEEAGKWFAHVSLDGAHTYVTDHQKTPIAALHKAWAMVERVNDVEKRRA